MPLVRICAALCFVMACSADHGHGGPMIDAPRVDASTIDSTLSVCRAASGTASVTANDHGTTQTWTRLHAGGLWYSGPVAVAGPPMSISLLFTDADPLDTTVGWCCQTPGQACCTADGIYAGTPAIPDGAEVGQHPVMISGTKNGFAFDGTLTITYFLSPFLNAPGKITGSITGSVAGQSVTGQFDNTFCAGLLTATI
jgi:hypothetical protein